MPRKYPDYAYMRDTDDKLILNHYMQPIVMAEHFEERHDVAVVPPSGGNPPVCTCGWTRDRLGMTGELIDHLRDQAPEFQPSWMQQKATGKAAEGKP